MTTLPATPQPEDRPFSTATLLPLDAAVFPNPDLFAWTMIVDNLEKPVGVYAPPGDGGQLFILEQAGRILLFQFGELQTTPFLDIRDRVGDSGNEQGLLGMAFSPNYTQNGYFYLDYTDARGDTVISRFRVSNDPGRADVGTEFQLMHIRQPYTNHNGGHLAFGPDGFLYVGMGDGGSGGDPHGNGQSTQTLLGKLLRIDVSGGDGYTIPADNPFAAGGGLAEIWAVGLRNPWMFSFDRISGDLWIADVGQNKWEEIDHWLPGDPAPSNFGWNFREGAHDYQNTSSPSSVLMEPVWEYGHDQGCSVTGGVVVRDSALQEWWGVYMFGDYCSGQVWGLLPFGNDWQAKVLFQTSNLISAFGETGDGKVLLVDHNGAIYQLTRNP